LVINSGDELSLEVNYNEQRISTKTTVPPKPQNVDLVSDTLPIPNVSTGIRDLPDIDYYSTTLTWDNLENSYYYVMIENVEENPEPIDIQFGKFASSFVSAPSISNE
jgi:hypothetical protein